MVEHTPGPWTRDINHVIQNAEGTILIADCYMEDNEDELNEANADLIVAAPDLLAALEGVAGHFCYSDDGACKECPPLRKRQAVWAAIAKAKGETSPA